MTQIRCLVSVVSGKQTNSTVGRKLVKTSSFIVLRPWLALTAMLLTSLLAFSQATSQISGTVKDPSGAIIAQVKVTVTQTDTGTAREVSTDDNGAFAVTNL